MNEVSLCYPVILRPSDVKFTVKTIPTKFDNGNKLLDVLEEMKAKKILPKEIPPIQVVWYCERWEWYTINNRRLWLYQQLEKLEQIKYASMNRVEVMNVSYTYPTYLYSEVVLYDPPWDIKTNTILNNRISNHAETYNNDDGKCSPTADDGGSDIENNTLVIEDDDAISVSSFKSTSSRKRRRERKRTSSCGTAVMDEIDYNEEEAEMSMEIDKDDDINREIIKMEILTPQKRGRSRSKTRRTRSPTRRGRKSHRSKSKSHRSKSKSHRSKSQSRVVGSKSVSNAKKSDDDVWSTEVKQGVWTTGDRKKSPSPSIKTRRSLSCVKDRKRSPSPSITTKRSWSCGKKDRSLSCGRSARSKSVSSVPVKGNSKCLIRYNSLYSENARFRNRTRSKSVIDSRWQSKESINDSSLSLSKLSLSKRSSSICSHLSRRSDYDTWSFDSRRRRSSSVCSHRSLKSEASSMNYQLDKFSHQKAPRYQRPTRNKYIENDFSTDYKYSSSRSLVKRSMDVDSVSSGYGSGALVVKKGIQLSHLYTLWASRRSEFLGARKNGQLHLMYGPEEGYLCGLCFKKFKLVVDLQQHSEELLHYACITCGRFFNTYTALGQHCNALYHTKD